MPRRRKPYVAPGKALVNGGRFNLPDDVDLNVENGSGYQIEPIKPDLELLRKKIKTHIRNYNELSQLEDQDRFVDDLVDECAWTQTLGLEYLVKGARTKPDEWTAQIFARGLAAVMKRHGLKATIWEYDSRIQIQQSDQIQQSLYLRLTRGLTKIAGFRVPNDVKTHALRAKRIDHKRHALRAKRIDHQS